MNRNPLPALAVGLVVCALAVLPVFAAGPQYAVSITNLTHGQVFTPVLVVSHGPAARLFEPGSAASAELEMLAEGGDTVPLAALLGTLPAVNDVAVSGGPVPPGQTVTVHVDAGPRGRLLSLAGMLVPTNDAFVSLNGVPGPTGNGVAMFTVPAWDAGTEANDELCASIPGPPGVCGGEGFNEGRDGAEGYVHIHAGVHGGADLPSAVRDWNNPVARVVIARLPGGSTDDDEDEDGDAPMRRGSRR